MNKFAVSNTTNQKLKRSSAADSARSATPGQCGTTTPLLQETKRFLARFPATAYTFQAIKSGAKVNPILHGIFDQHREKLVELNGNGFGIYWMVNEGDGHGRAASGVAEIQSSIGRAEFIGACSQSPSSRSLM